MKTLAMFGLLAALAGSESAQATPVITNHIVTVAGGGALVGDGGPATAALLNGPEGIAVDSGGNLYIAQFGSHRIRKVEAMTAIITTVAGTGVGGSGGDGGPATAAQLNTPRGVALDSRGNLYIGDSANNLVRRVDATTGIITTVAGGGAPADGLGDGGPATAAQLSVPFGFAFDSAGNLDIADGTNH